MLKKQWKCRNAFEPKRWCRRIKKKTEKRKITTEKCTSIKYLFLFFHHVERQYEGEDGDKWNKKTKIRPWRDVEKYTARIWNMSGNKVSWDRKKRGAFTLWNVFFPFHYSRENFLLHLKRENSLQFAFDRTVNSLNIKGKENNSFYAP